MNPIHFLKRGISLYLLKTGVVVVLCACLVLDSIAFAAPAIASENSAISSIKILKKLGRVEESFEGQNGKTVIYLQDAHDSLEAQENIAKMIGALVKDSGVKTVYEEGYEGVVPTDSYFGFIENAKLRKKISYFFLDKLRIGGAEYAHINRAKDFRLIGADSIKLHLENIAKYQESARLQGATRKDLEALIQKIRFLGDMNFSKEMKEWLKLRERFEGGELSLLDYLKRSQVTGHKSQGRGRNAFPVISLLLEAEGTKDAAALEKVKRVDAKELFREIDLMETLISERLLENDRYKQIFRHHKELHLLKRLNEIRVTPAEYENARQTLAGLNTRGLADFIARETGSPVLLSREWEKNIQSAIRFYEIAHARDDAMAKTMSEFMRNPTEETAVLVFGGFHKEKIKSFLQASGCSYLIVTPNLSGPDKIHQAYYKQLMSVGQHPFEIPAALARAARAATLFVRSSGRRELMAVYQRAIPSARLPEPIFVREIESQLASSRSELRMMGMGMGLRLAPQMRQDIKLTLRQQLQLKMTLQLLLLIQDEDPVPPDALKGLEGLINADEILKKRGLIGIPIGSTVTSIFNPSADENHLKKHKDLDILVLSSPEEISLQELIKEAPGIDWWVPEERRMSISSDISRIERNVRYWKNVNGVFIRAGFDANTSGLEPGLWLGDRDFYIALTKAVVENTLDPRVSIAKEVWEQFDEKIQEDLGFGYSPVWEERFPNRVLDSEIAISNLFDFQTATALNGVLGDVGKRKYENVLARLLDADEEVRLQAHATLEEYTPENETEIRKAIIEEIDDLRGIEAGADVSIEAELIYRVIVREIKKSIEVEPLLTLVFNKIKERVSLLDAHFSRARKGVAREDLSFKIQVLTAVENQLEETYPRSELRLSADALRQEKPFGAGLASPELGEAKSEGGRSELRNFADDDEEAANKLSPAELQKRVLSFRDLYTILDTEKIVKPLAAEVLRRAIFNRADIERAIAQSSFHVASTANLNPGQRARLLNETETYYRDLGEWIREHDGAFKRAFQKMAPLSREQLETIRAFNREYSQSDEIQNWVSSEFLKIQRPIAKQIARTLEDPSYAAAPQEDPAETLHWKWKFSVADAVFLNGIPVSELQFRAALFSDLFSKSPEKKNHFFNPLDHPRILKLEPTMERLERLESAARRGQFGEALKAELKSEGIEIGKELLHAAEDPIGDTLWTNAVQEIRREKVKKGIVQAVRPTVREVKDFMDWFLTEDAPMPESSIARRIILSPRNRPERGYIVPFKHEGSNIRAYLPVEKFFWWYFKNNRRHFWLKPLSLDGKKFLTLHLTPDGPAVGRALWNQKEAKFEAYEGPVLSEPEVRYARRRMTAWAYQTNDRSRVRLKVRVGKQGVQRKIPLIRVPGNFDRNKHAAIFSPNLIPNEKVEVEMIPVSGEKRVIVHVPEARIGDKTRAAHKIIRYFDPELEALLRPRDEVVRRFTTWNEEASVPLPMMTQTDGLGRLLLGQELGRKPVRILLGPAQVKETGRDVFVVFGTDQDENKTVKIYALNEKGLPSLLIWAGHYDELRNRMVRSTDIEPHVLLGEERYRVQMDAWRLEYADHANRPEAPSENEREIKLWETQTFEKDDAAGTRQLLAALIADPKMDWKKAKEENSLPDMDNRELGFTDEKGGAELRVFENFRMKWPMLGFQERGWRAVIVKGGVTEENVYQFQVQFAKEGREMTEITYQIGPETVMLRGEKSRRGKESEVLKISAVEIKTPKIYDLNAEQRIVTSDENLIRILKRIEKNEEIPEEEQKLSPRDILDKGVITLFGIKDRKHPQRRTEAINLGVHGSFVGKKGMPFVMRTGRPEDNEYSIGLVVRGVRSRKLFIYSSYIFARDGRIVVQGRERNNLQVNGKIPVSSLPLQIFSPLVVELLYGITQGSLPLKLQEFTGLDMEKLGLAKGLKSIYFWKPDVHINFPKNIPLKELKLKFEPLPEYAPDAWAASLWIAEKSKIVKGERVLIRPALPLKNIVLYGNGALVSQRPFPSVPLEFQHVTGAIPEVHRLFKKKKEGKKASGERREPRFITRDLINAHWMRFWLANGGPAPQEVKLKFRGGADSFALKLENNDLKILLSDDFRQGVTKRAWVQFPSRGEDSRGLLYTNSQTGARKAFVLYENRKFLVPAEVSAASAVRSELRLNTDVLRQEKPLGAGRSELRLNTDVLRQEKPLGAGLASPELGEAKSEGGRSELRSKKDTSELMKTKDERIAQMRQELKDVPSVSLEMVAAYEAKKLKAGELRPENILDADTVLRVLKEEGYKKVRGKDEYQRSVSRSELRVDAATIAKKGEPDIHRSELRGGDINRVDAKAVEEILRQILGETPGRKIVRMAEAIIRNRPSAGYRNASDFEARLHGKVPGVKNSEWQSIADQLDYHQVIRAAAWKAATFGGLLFAAVVATEIWYTKSSTAPDKNSQPIHAPARYESGKTHLIFSPHSSKSDFEAIKAELDQWVVKSKPDPSRGNAPSLLVITEGGLPVEALLPVLPERIRQQYKLEGPQGVFREENKGALQAAFDEYQKMIRKHAESMDLWTKQKRTDYAASMAAMNNEFSAAFAGWRADRQVRERLEMIPFEAWYAYTKENSMNDYYDRFYQNDMEGFYTKLKTLQQTQLQSSLERDRAIRDSVNEYLRQFPSGNVIYVVGTSHIENKDLMLEGLDGSYSHPQGLGEGDLRLGYAGTYRKKIQEGVKLSETDGENLLAQAGLELMAISLKPSKWTYHQYAEFLGKTFQAAETKGFNPSQAMGLVSEELKKQNASYDYGQAMIEIMHRFGWVAEDVYQQFSRRSELRMDAATIAIAIGAAGAVGYAVYYVRSVYKRLTIPGYQDHKIIAKALLKEFREEVAEKTKRQQILNTAQRISQKYRKELKAAASEEMAFDFSQLSALLGGRVDEMLKKRQANPQSPLMADFDLRLAREQDKALKAIGAEFEERLKAWPRNVPRPWFWPKVKSKEKITKKAPETRRGPQTQRTQAQTKAESQKVELVPQVETVPEAPEISEAQRQRNFSQAAAELENSYFESGELAKQAERFIQLAPDRNAKQIKGFEIQFGDKVDSVIRTLGANYQLTPEQQKNLAAYRTALVEDLRAKISGFKKAQAEARKAEKARQIAESQIPEIAEAKSQEAPEGVRGIEKMYEILKDTVNDRIPSLEPGESIDFDEKIEPLVDELSQVITAAPFDEDEKYRWYQKVSDFLEEAQGRLDSRSELRLNADALRREKAFGTGRSKSRLNADALRQEKLFGTGLASPELSEAKSEGGRSELRTNNPEKITDARSVEFYKINRRLIRLFAAYKNAKDKKNRPEMDSILKAAHDSSDYLGLFLPEIQGRDASEIQALGALEHKTQEELKNLAVNLGRQIKSYDKKFIAAFLANDQPLLETYNREVVKLAKERLKAQILRLRYELKQPDVISRQSPILTIVLSVVDIYRRISYEHFWRSLRARGQERISRFRMVDAAGSLVFNLYYEREPVVRVERGTDGELRLHQIVWKNVPVPGGTEALQPVLTPMNFQDLDSALRSRIHVLASQEQDFTQLIYHDLALQDIARTLKAYEADPSQISQLMKEQTLTSLESVLEGPNGKNGLRKKIAQVRDPKKSGKMLPMPGASLEAAQALMTTGSFKEAVGLIESARAWISARLTDIERKKNATVRKRDYAHLLIRHRELESALRTLDTRLAAQPLRNDALRKSLGRLEEVRQIHFGFIARESTYRDFQYDLQGIVAALKTLIHAVPQASIKNISSGNIAGREGLAVKVKRVVEKLDQMRREGMPAQKDFDFGEGNPGSRSELRSFWDPFKKKEAALPPVSFKDAVEHREMYDWLSAELPEQVGPETVRNATLIHFDFHPDTHVSFDEPTTSPVTSGNVIAKTRQHTLVKNFWWVVPPGINDLGDYEWDLKFFSYITRLGKALPPMQTSAILSIDYDFFASREERAVSSEEIDRRIDLFIESLKASRYNVAGIFLAESPEYTLQSAHIKNRLYQELTGLYDLQGGINIRSEMRRGIFNHKRTLIDFNDLASNFSDAQIEEIMFVAQKAGEDSKVSIYNVDSTQKLGKFLLSLKIKGLEVTSETLDQLAASDLRGFSGEVAQLSSRNSGMGAEKLKRVLGEAGIQASSIYSLAYQDKQSGTLGVGLKDIEEGKLKNQLPDYMAIDARGRIYLSDPSVAGAWQALYQSSLAFSRAA